MTYCVETKFGTDITNVDVRERLVCLQVTDGHDKGVRTKSLPLNDQLGHDGGVVGDLSQRSNPPLGGSQRRRVDCERLVLWIPCCCRLEPSHVGSMAQLRLRIASNDFKLLRLLEEELVLLWSALLPYCGHEHLVVHRQWRGLAHELDGMLEFLGGPFVLLGQLLETLASGKGGQDAIFATLIVVLRLVEDLLRREDFGEVVSLLQGLLGEEELGELVDIGVALCALLGQEVGALRRGGLEFLDPVWIGRHLGGMSVCLCSNYNGREREKGSLV